ncbi:uncharacterized protein METZ01_LOCUS263535 [marine metagenome]|uniref:Uncharacterized protein n=1 Tax=marine metagenome TaxID=408172 RepID=A0A382JJ41_9ZZZZ
MRTLAAAPIRLISPFHSVQSPQNAARNGEQIALKDELDMLANCSRSCQRSPQSAGRPLCFLVTFPEKIHLIRHLLSAAHHRMLRARSFSVGRGDSRLILTWTGYLTAPQRTTCEYIHKPRIHQLECTQFQ